MSNYRDIHETYHIEPEAKKRKRIFMWFFLVVQAIFILWIITGASTEADPTNCGSLSDAACNDASDAGTAIGLALIVMVWMAVDFLLAVGYVIYRLARRP